MYALVESPKTPHGQGALWRRIAYAVARATRTSQFKRGMVKVSRALEASRLEAPQAEANKSNATALQEILKSVESYASANIQLGNVLIAKSALPNGSFHLDVCTLTPHEMDVLNKKPASRKDLMAAMRSRDGAA